MKGLVIGIVITIILILGGFLIWSTQFTSEDTCKEIAGEGSKGACYAKLALETGDESFCEKFTHQTFEEICFSNVAQTNQDLDLCKKAGTQENFCYQKVARLKEDETICEKIIPINVRNGCYHALAVLKKDISICNKVVEGASDYIMDCPGDVQREIALG